MKKQRKIVYIIFIAMFFMIAASCLTDSPMKIPFQNYSPVNLGDGWEIATPEEASMDGEALKEIYRYVHDDDNLWQMRSLLVFRNGKLITESYMKDSSDRTTPRAVWSSTKQFIGILTGIAVDQGLISMNDTVLDHLPQVSKFPDKSQITIGQLLMMKSGIDFNNDGWNGGPAVMAREEPSNSLDYIFGLKMRASPGTQFHYNDGDPFIISGIIQSATGIATRDWAQEVLFNRIGITRLTWLNYKDGITFGGYGIKTTPRELGKIGQLVLNDGIWGTERIVSSVWLSEMLSEKVTAAETSSPDSAFGYLWWIETDRKVYIMWGRGGQLVFINKDKNLIVVATGETNTSGDFTMSVFDVLPIYDRINSITN